jgi:hypothetical protein
MKTYWQAIGYAVTQFDSINDSGMKYALIDMIAFIYFEPFEEVRNDVEEAIRNIKEAEINREKR